MATGEDSAGKAFKAVLPELKAVLQRTEAPLPPEDKMRLLMMCPLRPLPPARCLLLPPPLAPALRPCPTPQPSRPHHRDTQRRTTTTTASNNKYIHTSTAHPPFSHNPQ